MPPFRYYLGGHFGNGQQWFSWIHLDDVIRSICFLLQRQDLEGAFNLTSPNPLRSRQFFRTLGRVMGKPSLFSIPALAAKALLGEMAQELILASTRAIPRKLLAAGYEFLYPDAQPALQQILHKNEK